MATKTPYTPNEIECKSIKMFIDFLSQGGHEEDDIQGEIFNISKSNDLNPKDLFSSIYKLLSGSSSGPRLGSFIHLMGENEVSERLKKAIETHG